MCCEHTCSIPPIAVELHSAATTQALCVLAVEPQSSSDVPVSPVVVVMFTTVTFNIAALMDTEMWHS